MSALLHFRRPRSAQLHGSTLNVDDLTITLDSILQVHVASLTRFERLLGIASVRIAFRHKQVEGSTAILQSPKHVDQTANQIALRLTEHLRAEIATLEASLDTVEQHYNRLYSPRRYARKSAAKRFAEKERATVLANDARAGDLAKHAMLDQGLKDRARAASARLRALRPYVEEQYETQRERHNNDYLRYWTEQEADYFRSVESAELTDEQIAAALSFEDATLVAAAAGSGKSSCIVGKIGFAIKSGMFQDHEILALAYNKEAASSLKKRLQQKLGKSLGRSVSVQSRTFHGFGRSILLEHYGRGYEPRLLKEDGDEEGRFIKSVITDMLASNAGFQAALALWFSTYPYDDPQPVGVSGDVDECAKRYEECCFQRLRLRKDPNKRPWEPTIPTFRKDVHVRSLEERAIANWLVLHGVKFDYESADFDGGKWLRLGNYASGKPKPYCPDFTYRFEESLPNGKTRNVRIVHEHFALNARGQAPAWMGGQRYAERAQQKRNMYLARMRDQPNPSERVLFFETTSAQVRDGTIWESLENSLHRHGVQVGALDEQTRKTALEEFRKSSHLEQLIVDFVLRFKESGLRVSELRSRAAASSHPYRSQLFIDVAVPVFDAYQAALRKAGKIDYADMLRDAMQLLHGGRVKTPYRFVLVDEFQDISHLRAALVRSILDQNPDDSVVFCVGDDWQTVNRFSGSDVGIFTGLDRYFDRHTKRLELTRTFRCSQGIADVARDLVMRNPGQIDKAVKALAPKVPHCVRVVHHADSPEERRAAIEKELDRMALLGQSLGIDKPTVQILRRTTTDKTVAEGADDTYLEDLAVRHASQLTVHLHSLHGAKGLEADFVILVGLDSGYRGFPDERPSEPLIDLVLPALASSVEEERRLFYVGLTRARHAVTVLGAGTRPSEFLLELGAMRQRFACIDWVEPDEARIPCPRCGRGSLVKRPGRSVPGACSRSSACGYRAPATGRQ